MRLTDIATSIRRRGFEVDKVPQIADSLTMYCVTVGKWFYNFSGARSVSAGEEFDILRFDIQFDDPPEISLAQINVYNERLFIKCTMKDYVLSFAFDIPIFSSALSERQFDLIYSIWMRELPEMAAMAGFGRTN